MASISALLGPSDPEPHKPTPAPDPRTSPMARALVQQPERVEEHSNAPSPATTADGLKPADDQQPAPATSTASSKKSAKDVSSVYTGNKIRHLKKPDGIPLWRKDIQYDFLKNVFDDKTACFTKYSDGSKGHTFAEIYIDAMAKSSKCSKILKEKLLQDQDGAISMAMVCLLVNVGRMNTTLNFFPEMRAQLRTYHSIPALQAHQDPNAYKQLQDAPRLKSILKGATEDEPQPSNMEDLKDTSIPRTNPVNLIFVMSQYAPRITDVHFSPPREFFDLIVRGSLSSESRARAFLWLIWWYLESDFSTQASLDNPFGPGQYGDGGEADPLAQPLKVPALESLTEEQAAQENIDTEDEEHFGEVKRKERIAILASEPSQAMVALKRARKEKGLATYSDDETMADVKGPDQRTATMNNETASERTRSPSPTARNQGFQAVNAVAKPAQDMRINTLLNIEGPSSAAVSPVDSTTQHVAAVAPAPIKKGPGRGNWRRNKPKQDAQRATASGQEGGSHHVMLLPSNSQYGFVTETPGAPQNIQPAPTPGSGPTNHAPALASSVGSPVRGTISFQSSRSALDHVPTPSYQAQKRSRGITQHQSAVISHRKQQIDYTLDRRIRRYHARMQDIREHEGSIIRAWKRIMLMPPDYDSEEEVIKLKKTRDKNDKDDAHESWRSAHRGAKDSLDMLTDDADMLRRSSSMIFSGFGRMAGEPGDIGEEAKTIARSLRRAQRRLSRWQDERTPPGMAVLRRRHLQQRGLLQPQHRRRGGPVRQLSMDQDGIEIVDRGSSAAPRRRMQTNGSARSQRSRPRMERSMSARDAAKNDLPPLDDEDGGGELDEEDRELLGEVDADESESEDDDVDVDMEDDD